MTPPNASALADFIAGRDSPEAIELLRDALRRWAQADDSIPLQRYLGLRTAYDFRRAERDRWLRVALASAGSVGALAAAVRRFERSTWPCWRAFDIAPGHATEVQATLFYARRAGLGTLPESEKQLRRIVVADRDADSAKRVRAIAA